MVDPMSELSKLISQCKYEEAFAAAFRISDVSIVYWLCSQVCKFINMFFYFINVTYLKPIDLKVLFYFLI
jgi:hypothetical protein